MITLGALQLPDGLRWEDELSWSAIEQSAEYGLTGSLLIEASVKQAGRPITLRGGKPWAWMTRAEVLALIAAIDAVDEDGITLTLHDDSTHTVIGRYESGKHPVEAYPLPRVRDIGPADPGDDTMYYIEAIRLMEI